METQTTLKPILIGKDISVANRHTPNWEKAKAGLQNVVDSYHSMGLSPISSMEELAALFTDLPGFIYKRVTGGGVVIKGTNKKELSVNGAIGLELIGKPEGYDALEAATAAYASACMAGYGTSGMGRVHFHVASIACHFVIADGKVGYTDAVNAQIADAGCIYATTAKGQAYFCFFEKVTAAAFEEGILTANEIRHDGIVPADRLILLFQKYLKALDTKTKKPIFLTSAHPTNPKPFFDR